MGGPGSGNHYHWWRGSKKTVVEDCRELDVNRWVREGVIRPGAHLTGGWKWSDARTGEEKSSISYEVCTLDPAAPWVRLIYTVIGTQDRFDYRARLTATRLRSGGLRWWFVCPLAVRDVPCGRRAGKLYLPPRGHYFGCRHCHKLTYTSCQQHDPRVSRFRRTPGALAAILQNPEAASLPQLMLALKAFDWGRRRRGV